MALTGDRGVHHQNFRITHMAMSAAAPAPIPAALILWCCALKAEGRAGRRGCLHLLLPPMLRPPLFMTDVLGDLKRDVLHALAADEHWPIQSRAPASALPCGAAWDVSGLGVAPDPHLWTKNSQ